MYKTIEQAADRILETVRADFANKTPLRIAIDGRCAAGKSLLAECLHQRTGCTVLHMDDFYLQPKDRTKERLQTPGGNVDRERFWSEVLAPLCRGQAAGYQRWDCHKQQLEPAVTIAPAPLLVTEGAYSCHPDLWGAYDLHIFLTASLPERLRRIKVRSGEAALEDFKNKWIPLEEAYFAAFDVETRCALRLCTDNPDSEKPPAAQEVPN